MADKEIEKLREEAETFMQDIIKETLDNRISEREFMDLFNISPSLANEYLKEGRKEVNKLKIIIENESNTIKRIENYLKEMSDSELAKVEKFIKEFIL